MQLASFYLKRTSGIILNPADASPLDFIYIYHKRAKKSQLFCLLMYKSGANAPKIACMLIWISVKSAVNGLTTCTCLSSVLSA